MTVKLEVRDLTKIFGDQPEKALAMLKDGQDKNAIFAKTGNTVGVNRVSLTINEGEIFVIMGLSGSGKSTLVRLLNRLIEPTSGGVFLDGSDIATISDKDLRDVRRKRISMVFQNFALMPHLSVIDNTAFGLELAGYDKAERHGLAINSLTRVGLEAYAASYPDELSGGMKQRVGLARALTNNPDVLLMDEAFSALDPLIRTEMQDELLRLQSADNRTIVFISHDLDEAMRIGDRIAIMQDGELVQVGTPDEILNNPANDYVRSFFRGVDIANVYSALDIARKKPATVIQKSQTDRPTTALQLLDDDDRDYGIVVDKGNQYVGMVTAESLREAETQGLRLADAIVDGIDVLLPETPVGELIGTVASAPYSVPVVCKSGQYFGVITKARLLHSLNKEAQQ
uniref:glycine betaine/L-proline ABC transporter ATP-binding protein ProV n=1 Tax=Thaumasiovibrio occultus TaxID=1891184 RepID=UPI000B35901D|nr:glycine betaine/L-proline ABC transporter ATP-binding protein ProV [Thaumasiovibrio occultus]